MAETEPDPDQRRLHRQLLAVASRHPRLRRALEGLLRPRLWPLRLVVALLLVAGGVLSVLPGLGIWMLPLGLLLLAVDLPFARRTAGACLVRARWSWRRWRRRRRRSR